MFAGPRPRLGQQPRLARASPISTSLQLQQRRYARWPHPDDSVATTLRNQQLCCRASRRSLKRAWQCSVAPVAHPNHEVMAAHRIECWVSRCPRRVRCVPLPFPHGQALRASLNAQHPAAPSSPLPPFAIIQSQNLLRGSRSVLWTPARRPTCRSPARHHLPYYCAAPTAASSARSASASATAASACASSASSCASCARISAPSASLARWERD